MTPNTKSLLLVVALLASLQWLVVPILGWQNDRVAVIGMTCRRSPPGKHLWGNPQLERNATVQQRLWSRSLSSRLSRAQLRRLRCSGGLLRRSRTGS